MGPISQMKKLGLTEVKQVSDVTQFASGKAGILSGLSDLESLLCPHNMLFLDLHILQALESVQGSGPPLLQWDFLGDIHPAGLQTRSST